VQKGGRSFSSEDQEIVRGRPTGVISEKAGASGSTVKRGTGADGSESLRVVAKP